MGYKDAGMYVAPVLDLQDIALSCEHFEGYLLSMPIPFWRVLDIYDLERRFTSFHFRPFVELDRKEAHELCLLMRLMESPLREGIIQYDDMELLHLCRAFVATLNRYYETQDARTTGNRYVDEFLSLVEKHCPKEKKLDFYSDRLGISTKYLSTVVSRVTGKAASRWIMDRVIEMANNYLFSTSLQISEIACALGFTTSSDFCKYYRTYTGLTPMQYRKACLKQGTLINID